MSQLTLTLLGGFAVQSDGRPITRFRTQKARALLAYLVMESQQPHERATLAALLWPEMPDAPALRNLTQNLVWLRRAIAGDNYTTPFLFATRHQVQWNEGVSAKADTQLDTRVDVDALRFLSLIERHNQRDRASATADLEAAVALYRGDFLAGFSLPDTPAFDEWLLLRREQLRRLMLEALFTLANHSLASGDYQATIRHARQQLSMDHWREEAYRQLIHALAASGRSAEALAEYDHARRLLRNELGVEPQAETSQLAEAIRRGKLEIREWRLETGDQAANLQSPVSTLHNLPTRLTPLLGRAAEIVQLKEWLQEPGTRLITITGIGGTGKTRLALALASSLLLQPSPLSLQPFPDGIWFVPLDGLDSNDAEGEESFVAAVASALGLTFTRRESRRRQLERYLHGRRLLLLLDNYEHLFSMRPILLDLLHNLPGLSVLVTSRERLNLSGERLLQLEGLPVPAASAAASQELLLANSSARLFFERARERGVHLTLDEAERRALVQICQLCEGSPLAIELAAAWAGHFTCAEIAVEIAANLDFLQLAQADLPPRQRSPRAAFDYSWQLLSATEQRALAQLSLLQGRFHRDAALAVSQVRLLDLLTLVNKSLLRQVSAGWYSLHPLISQFAREHLDASGQRAAADLRYATYFLRFLAAREIPLQSDASAAARVEIEEVIENIRPAWQWAIRAMTDNPTNSSLYTQTFDLLNQSLFALALYYRSSGLYGEEQDSLQRLQNALSLAPAADTVPPLAPQAAVLLGRVLAWQAILQIRRNYHLLDALAMAEAAVRVSRQTADLLTQALARYAEGTTIAFSLDSLSLPGGYERIHATLEEAITLCRAVSAADGTIESYRAQVLEVNALNRLAYTLSFSGQWTQATACCEAALAICKRIGHLPGEGLTSANLADILEKEGVFEQALRYREAAYSAYQQIGDPNMESISLNNLCGSWTYLGDYREAQTVGRRALAIRQQHGLVSPFLYHSLALAAFHLGDLNAALQLVEQGLAELPLAPQTFNLQLLAGEIHLRLEDWPQAKATLETTFALALRQENQQLTAVFHPPLAELALAQGDTTAALRHVEAVLPDLLANKINNQLEPLRAFWSCYRVLAAVADPRACGVLTAAHTHVQTQAALIQDAALRHAFLHHVSANREIVVERRKTGGEG